jgi:dipeptidyl aminopeptidase/acylaminoacyl peptidase
MAKTLTRALLLTLALLATLGVAAQKESLTHETLWLMKRVGAPNISPDGKWVAFSISEPSYDSKEAVDDLWLVPADGSAAPRRLTFSKAGESDVAWSGDSRRIAFSAKRDGDEQNQIYVIDVANGGEAQRMTSSPTGARRPRFSPDGKSVVFTSSVFPGAADDEANRKAAKAEKDRKVNVRVFEQFPVRSWDRWLEDKQTHIFVQQLDPAAKAKDVLSGTKLIVEKGFGGAIGGDGPERIDTEWSPDGQWIVFGITTTRNTAAFAEVSTDLYRVRASGGEPERIASGTGSYGNATFSPDGKTLFTSFNPNDLKVYNNSHLVAFDWPAMTNQRRITAPSFDRSAGNFAITPDGRTIYFTAEDSGFVKIFSVPASGGEPKVAVEPERGVYSDLAIAESSAAPVIVARWGSSVNPNEIVRIDPTAKKHRNLTTVNVEKAASIDWQPPEHFWFTSKRGKRIQNLLVKPEKFDPARKYPLFVLMHGGPASMWTDSITLRWNYHLLAKPGYVLVLTNYTGSTGFGEKFAQEIQGDPLKGPAEEINEAADEAIRKYPFIDGTRQVAGGASYGGHLANAMQAWHSGRYKALISHAGLINLESQWGTSDVIYGRELMNGGPVWEQGPVWREQNPIRFANQFRTPMLLSVGEKDFRVPLNQTLENWSALQRNKVPSRLLVWPDENHWILNGENSRYFYKEVADWLARWAK